MVDGKGRVLMPGIVDGHAEVIELGFTTLTLDLSTTRSLMEAQGRVTAYAAAHPDRAWVLGRGWDETRWGTGIFPTVADLDAASGARCAPYGRLSCQLTPKRSLTQPNRELKP